MFKKKIKEFMNWEDYEAKIQALDYHLFKRDCRRSWLE